MLNVAVMPSIFAESDQQSKDIFQNTEHINPEAEVEFTFKVFK